ncbi:hypothetical protein SDC9_131931 [bioreactor metagenome]|uniref:Uncharacterized protein n=1 Tax=bioreactor metagenome TaxID=1076179 RepID=A0A645D6M8_9ZZZZ
MEIQHSLHLLKIKFVERLQNPLEDIRLISLRFYVFWLLTLIQPMEGIKHKL